MIEGGSSRNYIDTKKMMYADPTAWPILMEKLVTVLAEYAAQQVAAGADVIQVFDSWVGALSVHRLSPVRARPHHRPHRSHPRPRCPHHLLRCGHRSLLPAMSETGADVLGLDWRTPLDHAWRALDHAVAVQGNLDPIALFAPPELLHARVAEILAAAAGRPGHIFNLGHGIVPNTPVDAVLAVVQQIKNSR